MKRKAFLKVDALTGLWQTLIGIAVCCVVGLLGVAIAAWMTEKGSIGESMGDIASTLIAFVSSFAGAFVCMSLKKEKYLVQGLINAGGYLFVLAAINIVIFDGTFSGFLRIVLPVVIGATLCALLKSKIVKMSHRPKFKIG